MARNKKRGHVLLIISNSISFQINATNRTFTSSYLQILFCVLSGLRNASTTSRYAFHVCFFQLAIMPFTFAFFHVVCMCASWLSFSCIQSLMCIIAVPERRNYSSIIQELSLRTNRAAKDCVQLCGKFLHVF